MVKPIATSTIEMTYPPYNATGSLAFAGEHPLYEFKPCNVPKALGKVSIGGKTEVKAGGGQSGAVLGAGVSVDLKFSLFGGLFKSTFPIFAVEPNFFGGSSFCPKCPVAKLTAFGVVFPIPPN